ncbi:hypothetical protein NADFUDRAFT_83007 [Nadsonia fulvescens var. elongata DSM 6958]|uniref:Uncharacterized protein n=1 Tax=Nadsonia fulvescens var. elongata DSM 6958 TaxID=857566 RepID=A0A1E3PL46_9ASCO|nr:hypothetical protein NADFUDRAFT_83007 [Nadsonia fulvescens var. elongata DSM 6958]
MDSELLSNLVANIYIPPQPEQKPDYVPDHHPSLIMQDCQTDTTHHLACGCVGGACISQHAWWMKDSFSSHAEIVNPSLSRRSSDV